MPVTTLRIVGDDDMRPMMSQDGDQLGPNRVGRHFGEMLIPIAEYLDVSTENISLPEQPLGRPSGRH